jgi:NADPH:quinone reductase-like Zn-dependent oxidoreductase
MRALRFDRYGPPDVLYVDEVPEPVPGEGCAKVRVHAVALNPLDAKVRAGDLRLLPIMRGPPRGLGCDFAGEVAAVGGGAGARHVGERVFGSLLPFGRDGALAQFIVVSFGRLLPIPDGVEDAHAAALPTAGGTALQALNDAAQLRAGQRVLITGAAGGVGHFAVQIAHELGAYVVGVCSAANVDFVRSLGADAAIDYAREDFTQRGDRFDVVFDAAGASSFRAARRVLTDTGRYINTLGDAAAMVATGAGAAVARLTSRQRAIPFMLRNQPPTWQRLIDRVRAGALRVHVERVIGLEEVAATQRQTGHARGKTIVRVDPGAPTRPGQTPV